MLHKKLNRLMTGFLQGLLMLLLLPLPILAAGTFDPALQPTGSVPKPELSSNLLASGTQIAYLTSYSRADWTGNLYAYPIDSSAVVNTSADHWTDGIEFVVSGQNYDTGRNIVTMGSNAGVAFRWANLSATDKDSIDAADATRGAAIVNFVRGDRSNEGTSGYKFRTRGGVIGDIIHSRALKYGNYIYVGANDGMLHVIDATTSGGNEVWAYVPKLLIPKLKNLVASPYAHNYYVDGAPEVGFAKISGAAKEILVGTLGAGGKGLFALDITAAPTSESDAASKVLWEKNSADTGFANLGYTYARAAITEVRTSTGHTSAVIVGNGYLNSGNGHASLFVLSAADGSVIAEIDTGSGSAATPNGLSSAKAYDKDGDEIVDYVYAGDIDGNLWKFDLTDADKANWTAVKLFATGTSITSAPSVARFVDHDSNGNPVSGYMVCFGTGRMLTDADTTDTTTTYAVYGIWDGAPAANNGNLLAQTLTEKSWGTLRVRTSSMNSMDYTSGGHQGWKLPLPAGERVVGDGTFISSSRFYFTSTNPTIQHANPPHGENWLMEMNYKYGGGADIPFLDLSGDLLLTDADRVQSGGSPVAGVAGVPVGKYISDGVASQPTLVQLNPLNSTLFTFNPDAVPPPPPPGDQDRGVSGGHFDFDIHYGNYTCKTKKGKTECNQANDTHIHQYDDIFDVTGVNMRNASDTSMNLTNAIPGSSTPFKILVANQAYNPAVVLKVGGENYISVQNYNTKDINVAAPTGYGSMTAMLNSLPTYVQGTPSAGSGYSQLVDLILNMPRMAFTEKNWGTGVVRPGLMPTQTGCVKDQNLYGPAGEWRNGALTVELIDPNTPPSAVQMNVAGHPELGYRIKAATNSETTYINQYLLAEYTIFWHHKTLGVCFGEAGWTATPGVDTKAIQEAIKKGVKTKTPAPGSADPQGYSFDGTLGAAVDIKTTVVGQETTTVYTYADDTTKTVVTTEHSDGSFTIVTTMPDGTTSTQTVPPPKGFIGTGGEESGSGTTGRISWRQLLLN